MGNRADRTAIVGATLIDGNGGEPVERSAVFVEGSRIVAVGTQDSLSIPHDCERIDATGKFLTPGFIDTNVHLAPYWNPEELARYQHRRTDIALETAQLLLNHGVTTVRDSYGALGPLAEARDIIASREKPGPRVLVAGNIIGWGGPGSFTFGSPGPFSLEDIGSGFLFDSHPSYFMEQMQDEITQGVGEELIEMEPDELRVAVNAYLDKGVDFVKYGGTSHAFWPAVILFSPRAQEVIVEETHKRGKVVDVHSTSPEGARISILAGVDLVQHPECLDVPMSDDLAALHASHRVVCSMNMDYWTGRKWQEYLEEKEKTQARSDKPTRPLTGLEKRKERVTHFIGWCRSNAEKLIASGCTVSVASDSVTLRAADFTRGTEPYHAVFSPGEATLVSIEGLVEIGMKPMQALVAATKYGAMASKALDDYGTVEAGKSADLLLLDDDPLADIHNIRHLSLVMARGQIIDRARLPTNPVYYRPGPATIDEAASVQEVIT